MIVTIILNPFIQGIDWVYHDDAAKITSGNIYLLGELRREQGFPGYYFVAFIFKEPLGLIALLCFSAVIFIRGIRTSTLIRKEIFLLVPIVFFGIYFNFFFNTQVGIRHFLVIYPMMYVFIGRIAPNLEKQPATIKAFAITIMASIAISTLSYHRHYLSYFNELVWDRKMAYKILADSNLDWGQSQRYLEDYLLDHPESIFQPEQPTPGTIIVGVNNLVGVFSKGYTQFEWLRKNFEPIDHIGYSYLVYYVPPNSPVLTTRNELKIH